MVNKCIFIGRVGKDIEPRYAQSGSCVVNFSIACTEKWTKDGERKEKTEWVPVSMFGKLAEITAEYVKKGDMVFIEGAYQTRKWQDQGGNDRYTTEIIAREMKMLSPRGQGEPPPSSGDDVPF